MIGFMGSEVSTYVWCAQGALGKVGDLLTDIKNFGAASATGKVQEFIREVEPFKTEWKGMQKALVNLQVSCSLNGLEEEADKISQLLFPQKSADIRQKEADKILIDRMGIGNNPEKLGLTPDTLLSLLKRSGEMVTYLDLSDTGSFAITDVRAYLDHCPNIKTLMVKNCKNCPNLAKKIAKHPNAKGLEVLRLYFIDAGAGGAELIAKNLSKLRELTIVGGDICLSNGERDLRGLKAIGHMEHLECLDLSCNKMERGDAALLSNIKTLVSLFLACGYPISFMFSYLTNSLGPEDIVAFSAPRKASLRSLILPKAASSITGYSPPSMKGNMLHKGRPASIALKKIEEAGTEIVYM